MICFSFCVVTNISNDAIHEDWTWFSYHPAAGLHYYDLEGGHGPICQRPSARVLWNDTSKIEISIGPALATWHQQSEICGLRETYRFEFDGTFSPSHPQCPRKDLLLENWNRTVQDDIEAKKKVRRKNIAHARSPGVIKFDDIVNFLKRMMIASHHIHSNLQLRQHETNAAPKWKKQHARWAEENEVPAPWLWYYSATLLFGKSKESTKARATGLFP